MSRALRRDADAFVANSNSVNFLYKNNGNFVFERVVGAPFDEASTTVSSDAMFGDMDGDGDVDIVVSNQGSANDLYENVQGVFRKVKSGDVVASSSDQTVALAWADWDNDNDLDLIMLNSFGTPHTYENTQGGAYTSSFLRTELTSNLLTAAQSSTSAAWGDIDGDGDLDVSECSLPCTCPTPLRTPQISRMCGADDDNVSARSL